MIISGQPALALNLVTIGVLSFSLTIIVLSCMIPAVLRCFNHLSSRARQKILWSVVLVPWISMIAAVGVLILPEFLSKTPSWFTARFHWHHSLVFDVVSWHSVASLFAIFFLLVTSGRTFYKAVRYSRYVSQLQYISETQANKTVAINTDTLHAFTAGWFKPQVYISKGLSQALSPEEYNLVFQHEAAHVRRNDPLRMLLFSWFSVFFPLFLSRQLEQWMSLSIEQLADESTLVDTQSKMNVAHTLVKVTRLLQDQCADNARSSNALCAYTGSSLEMRIKYLFNQGVTPPFLTLSTFAIASTLLLLSVVSVDWLHHSIELFLLH